MIIAVDFDGTIVEHAYPKIGKPIPFAIDVLKRLQDEDRHQLIMWTVRSGALLEEAVEYCRAQGLEFYAINKSYPEEVFDDSISRKLNCDLFIDDRNLGGMLDWGIIYRMIKNKQTYAQAFSEGGSLPQKPKRGLFNFLKNK